MAIVLKCEIVRHFMSGRNYTLRTGVSLDEAQEHCNSLEASSRSSTSKTGKARTRKCGAWFDGYYREA